MKNTEIRPATPNDAATIHGFIGELADYEKLRDQFVATTDDLKKSLFAKDSPAEALVALIDGEPVGYALYFKSYSTFLAKPGIYLEDLYVTPKHRGSGAGKALLKRVAQVVVERGYGRLEWSVLDWNKPAIEFYLSFGAQPMSDWTMYRLTGKALAQFATK